MMNYSKPIILSLQQKFAALFEMNPLLCYSPGRINLIGEHLDYNNGFVLPAAIDKAIYTAISKRNDDLIVLYSMAFNEKIEVRLSEIKPIEDSWGNYVLGVVAQLQSHQYKLQGFNLIFDGDIPIGAGLSSSAAVECAAIYALNELFDLKINKIAMVKMAQKAEHEYAGVMCGIMDQFASMMGKENHVIKLDCRSLEYEYVPLQLAGYKIVLMDTQVKHSLASSEYNTRRNECEEGVRLIQKKYPQVYSLRDADIFMVNELLDHQSKVFARCKYIVEEIERLNDACVLLKQNNIKAFGQKLYATHDGLSKLYEVSCTELDFIADACKKEEDVIGARMMGGGFGGCVIALVNEQSVNTIIERISKQYQQKFAHEMKAYITQLKDGASSIKN